MSFFRDYPHPNIVRLIDLEGKEKTFKYVFGFIEYELKAYLNEKEGKLNPQIIKV